MKFHFVSSVFTTVVVCSQKKKRLLTLSTRNAVCLVPQSSRVWKRPNWTCNGFSGHLRTVMTNRANVSPCALIRGCNLGTISAEVASAAGQTGVVCAPWTVIATCWRVQASRELIINQQPKWNCISPPPLPPPTHTHPFPRLILENLFGRNLDVNYFPCKQDRVCSSWTHHFSVT